MIWLDYIALLSLVLLAGAAVFWGYFWLRIVTLAALFLTGVFFEMSLDPIARGVISRQHREGKWTQQYSDGVDDMERATRTYRPYRLIAITGLAFLAFWSTKKDRASKVAAPSQTGA